MIKRFIKLASFIALIVHSGCRPTTNSLVKKQDTDVHDDFVRATAHMQLTCPETAMVVLIGSSEPMSRIESWNITTPTADELNAERSVQDKRFQASIDKAHSDLKAALARDPNCKTELMYAAVIDGPSQNDSKIETVHYRYTANKWSQGSTKSWVLSGDRLEQSNAASELDTSRDVTKIVRILASNEFQTVVNSTNLSNGTAAPGQVAYVIKAHGGRVATTERFLPDLEILKEQSTNPLQENEWEPAILADTNGPQGPLRSPAFSPRWRSEDIKKVFGAGSANTSGDGGSSSTSGDGGSSSTSGDFDRDEILSSGDGGEEATSGKALAFSEAIVSLNADKSDGRTRFGAYATYLAPHTSGIGRLTLPVASRKPASSATQVPAIKNQDSGPAPLSLTAETKAFPKNLVILDSCYGSEKIMSALDYQGNGSKSNTVVLASVSPIYFEFLDYSKLGLSDLLKFPALLERLKKGTNLSADEQALLKNMESGSLTAPLSELKNNEHKKLSIWVD